MIVATKRMKKAVSGNARINDYTILKISLQ